MKKLTKEEIQKESMRVVNQDVLRRRGYEVAGFNMQLKKNSIAIADFTLINLTTKERNKIKGIEKILKKSDIPAFVVIDLVELRVVIDKEASGVALGYIAEQKHNSWKVV